MQPVRHGPVMAVPGLDPGISPGHLDFVKRGAFPIEITGTRPLMTWRGSVAEFIKHLL
jgi:hypothetical protein